MNKIKLTIIILSILLGVSCKENTSNENFKKEIDTYIKEQMHFQKIPGLALGVIKDGEIIYEGYFGEENIETNTIVNKNTIFPIFSITKLMVNTGVFQLIEQGKISLDDNISKYLDNIPKNWQGVKIQHLITHSSGLPDLNIMEGKRTDEDVWAELIQKDTHFDLGDRFEYNQTNYWLLARMIEKVSGVTFEDFIINGQFPNKPEGVVFSSDFTDNFSNRSSLQTYNNEKEKYDIFPLYGGRRFHPANGMNITLKEIMEWNSRLDNNELLEEATKLDMWKPFKYTSKTLKFLQGWHTYKLNESESIGFTGGERTGFRKFIDNDMTIVVLTNGHKYYASHNDIINRVAGIVESSLYNHKSIVQHKILTGFLLNDNTDDAIKNYYSVKKENVEQEKYKNTTFSYENTLNSIGYILIRSNKLAKAIDVFKLNVEENPKSSNCYDSLAEAYLSNNELGLAKDNYEIALKLYPESDNAKKMLETIKEKMEE
ncbi:MAG: serine hydrolase [Flavobacteriaceae bacterium]|nr:serine hydrolase [Flavobacteriaceae bacterium]